ncbi:MAG: bifunctional 5,10-methylenetetrahydrofolate dehydrogenase/5,10-methenyltetrahydrofolate cyclohydrolase [bacterium]
MAKSKVGTYLDGKELAEKLKLDLRKKIVASNKEFGLAAILIGDDPASHLYVKLKEKACQDLGINFHRYLFDPKLTSEKEVLEAIAFLNKDEDTTGILVQLPLPEGFDANKIVGTITKEKDVDGFITDNSKIQSPVSVAVTELLNAAGDFAKNKSKLNALIIAKDGVLANDLKKQLQQLNLKTVTHETNIPKNSTDYDVIVIALGKPQALNKTMIKKDAIIIDIGINKLKDKTVGDVAEDAIKQASFISPVPGGVGPLTVAGLMKNLCILAEVEK